MSQPFVGQISMFGFNFAPRGWAECAGQLMSISQNDALFSLVGTMYGGDGRTTFGLPDFRGRAPMSYGTGPGLSTRRQGVRGGTEYSYLTTNSLPTHSHPSSTENLKAAASQASIDIKGSSENPGTSSPDGAVCAKSGRPVYHSGAGNVTMQTAQGTVSGSISGDITIGTTGSGTLVPNVQPSLTINFCIALIGIYPSRN